MSTLPLAPTSLNWVAGNTQLSLTWPAVSGATGYNIYRRTKGSAGPPALFATVTGTLFTDTGLVNGTLYYYYAVAAVNAGGTGATYSVDYYTPAPSAKKTLAPTNVAVVAGSTQATVTWKPVFGATGYDVIVAESPGGPKILNSYSCYGSSCKITGLINERIYYFRVSTYSSGNGPASAYAAEVSATPLTKLPLAPTGLAITSGNNQLSLTWTAVSGAASYKVYRRTEGSAWSAAPVATSTGTLFTDTGLVNGTLYYYAVAAVNADGTGGWSGEVSNTPAVKKTSAPTNVAAVAGNTQVTVTWDPVAGATAYYVAVATALGGTAVSGSGYPSGPSYTATGLTNGQSYYFRVQTYFSGAGPGSAYSAEVSATPSSPPDTGTISGRVSVNIAGSSNLAVQNATVALLGTAYSTQTDYTGNFILPNVPFADYKLVISAPDMVTLTKDITLSVQNLPVTIPQMAVSSPDYFPGDANGDNRLGLDDVIYILQWLTGARP
ncbi:MAG: fibronectin type III domain-containing protein [Syntrophales bacterium]|nr:fibronectin type III domain-containing protein [Syntrophales bacterium]